MEQLGNMVVKLFCENVLKNISLNKQYLFIVIDHLLFVFSIDSSLFIDQVGKQNIPVVCVVVEGGKNTIGTVLEYVTEEPPVRFPSSNLFIIII